MAGAKGMVTGFNHNIRHRGKMYHIQTEDSGLGNPHIVTHLFLGGNILASKKTSYADIAGADNLGNVVRELMEEQHKEVLRNLVNGVYDVIHPTPAAQTRNLKPSTTLQPGKPPAARSQPPPVPAVERRDKPAAVKNVADTLFGEDLISEKSLDEVILSYLAEDMGKKG
jgi:hypothetical protein